MRRRGASFFRHLIFDEAGAAGAIVALSLVALLGIAALATDLGFLYTAQMKLQAATDAAALAGAQDINVGAGGTAIPTAIAYSSAPTGANATNNLPATMAPGFPKLKCLHAISATCSGPDGAVNAIVVTENASVPTFFAKVFGIQSWNISATALAGVGGGGQGPADVMVVLDTVGGNPVLSVNLGNPLTYLAVGASDPASLADAPNAPCRMNTTPGSNGNVLTETLAYALALLGQPSCAATSTSKISTSLAGIQTFLKAMQPCSPTLATCGPVTNGNVANPYAEVGLTVFPGLTNASQAQYDYETNCATQPSIIAYHLTPTYQVVPLSSDYRTSDTATSLNGGSNMALAAGGASGCGAWAVNPTSFTLNNPALELLYGSYYAAAIDQAQQTLANDERPNARKVIIFLSDGNADALSGITSIGVANGGSGYTNGANVIVSGGMGSGAQATATVVNGVVTAINLTNPGSGYSSISSNAVIQPKPVTVLGIQLPGPGSGALLTIGMYPGLNQCQQGVAAAGRAKTAGTQIYSISYGASNLTLLPPAVTCLTDLLLATSACQAMQQIASDPTTFYNVNVNGSACASSANSQSDLNSIFASIAARLSSARLLPPNTS